MKKENIIANHGHSLAMVLFSILCLNVPVMAQRPNFGQDGGVTPVYNQTQDEQKGPDSTVYNYILLTDIYTRYKRTDTMADIAFMYNNLLISKTGDYVNTGNFGSSACPILFDPRISTGFFTGYDQYKIYQIKSDNFRFYEQNRPLSDLYFSQQAGLDNINVRADFSRNFSDGLSISINYARLSQKGFFTGQDVKHTAFGIGLRYVSKSDKYNAFLLFFQNASEESHIGSITDPAQLNAEFNRDLSVVLSEANTRHQEQEYVFIQNLKLTSTHKSGFNLYLKNDLKYKPSYFKFSDTNLRDANDTAFYVGVKIDARGIRRYVNIDHISNSFYVNGEKTNGIKGRLGLITDYFSVIDGNSGFKRFDVTGTFDGKLPLFKNIFIETKGKLGLGKNAGSFDISGLLNFDVGKLGTLNGFMGIFRSETPYNANRLVINDIIQFDTSFSKPFGTQFGGELYIKSIKLKAKISQSVINNPIYSGNDGRPQQAREVFSASRLSITHQLRVGHFHFDNAGHVQLFSSDLYALPPLFSTHQLYYGGAWFKKAMNVQTGIDVRLIPDYKGSGYHPLYGSFHTSGVELKFFPAANYFFLARVSSFRVMFMMENVTQSFLTDHNFDVVGHPQNEMKYRFGIQWLLKD